MRPPARRIAARPSTPSRPIPVRITANALRPKAAATDWKSTVPEGRKPPTAGEAGIVDGDVDGARAQLLALFRELHAHRRRLVQPAREPGAEPSRDVLDHE